MVCRSVCRVGGEGSKRRTAAEGGGQGLAQLGDGLGVGLEQRGQEARRQAVPQDGLHEQADGADVDPGAEGLRTPSHTRRGCSGKANRNFSSQRGRLEQEKLGGELTRPCA